MGDVFGYRLGGVFGYRLVVCLGIGWVMCLGIGWVVRWRCRVIVLCCLINAFLRGKKKDAD